MTKLSSCIFTMTSFADLPGPATGYAYGAPVNNEFYDRTGTQYLINNLNPHPHRVSTGFAACSDTYVRQVDEGLRTFEIASVGWIDDTTTSTLAPQKHNVTLVTGLFQ